MLLLVTGDCLLQDAAILQFAVDSFRAQGCDGLLHAQRVKISAGQVGLLFSGTVYQYATPLRSQVSRAASKLAEASWLEVTIDTNPGVYRQRADMRAEPFAFVLATYLAPDPDPDLYDPPHEREDEALDPSDVRGIFDDAAETSDPEE